MDASVRGDGSALSDSELPTQEAVLRRLDDSIAVVVGKGITDYYGLELALIEYYNEIFDAGVIFIVAEPGTGFLRYLLSKGYRCAIMTPKKEHDYIKGPAMAAFIASRSFGAGSSLKSFCIDHKVPSRLFVVDNSMTQT